MSGKGNPLAGYGSGIRKETLLGWVAWYGISEPKVKWAALKKQFETLKLDLAALPAPIRPGDAFKRASRYANQDKLVIPGTETYANVLIRNVAQSSEMIERHIVVEVVDANGRKLAHHDAVALTFYKKRYSLSWTHRGKSKTEDFNLRQEVDDAAAGVVDPDMRITESPLNELKVTKLLTEKWARPIIDAAIAKFIAEFDFAREYLDGQTLRGVIRKQLDIMRAFSLKTGHSIYFIPKTEETKAIALTSLLQWMGNGSDFHILPLIDTEKQREMIQAAFEDEVHEEAKQMLYGLQEALNTRTQLTAAQWLALRERKEALQSRAAEYSDLIDREFVKAGTELALLDDMMSQIFMDDLVKPEPERKAKKK